MAFPRVVHLRNGNHLARGVNVPTLATGTADALYPLTFAYDRDPGVPFKYAAAIADAKLQVDTNLLGNPGFETVPLVGWIDESSGGGSTSDETTLFDTGAHALKCQGGAGGIGQRYRAVTVHAGEQLRVAARMRADGTVNARLRVYCVELNQWLNSSGAFQAGATDVATETGTSYVSKSKVFTMPSFASLRLHTVTLRIYCRVDQNGAGYFDTMNVVPATDWLSIHGHNIEPSLAIQLRSSDDFFAADDVLEGTATVIPGRFYLRLSSPVTRRYFRVVWSGTPSVAQQVGEVVLGQSYALGSGPLWGWSIDERQPQVRSALSSGVQFATPIAEPLYRLELPFTHRTTDWDELRRDLFERSRFGSDPIVFCPTDDEPLCLLGRVSEVLPASRAFLDSWSPRMRIDEAAFGLLAA
jgi:hypothetical protein